MATHPICDDPGATDDWGHGEVTWGQMRSQSVFHSNLQQDGDRDVQMVPNDFARQSASEKWFHDLSSQSKFSRQQQNKIFECMGTKHFQLMHMWNQMMNSYLPTYVIIFRLCEGRASCVVVPW